MANYTVLVGYKSEQTFKVPKVLSFFTSNSFDGVGQLTASEEGLLLQSDFNLVIPKGNIISVRTVREKSHKINTLLFVAFNIILLASIFTSELQFIYQFSSIVIINLFLISIIFTNVWLRVEFNIDNVVQTMYFMPIWGARRRRWTFLQFQDVKHLEKILKS